MTMVGAVHAFAMVHQHVLQFQTLPALTTVGTTIGKSVMREQGQLECMAIDVRMNMPVDGVSAMVNRSVNERTQKQKQKFDLYAIGI